MEDEEENDQPLDLTVKRSDGNASGDASLKKAEDLPAIRENGIAHPKKRSWLKMEEEDDSFPHEIEEWKKTFAAGLCG